MHNKHRFTRTTLAAMLGGAIILVAGTATAAVTCWNFESIQEGTQYVVGNAPSFATADVEFKRFQSSNGSWTNNGYAEIVQSNYAQGSSDQELWLNNINASVISASFLYADLGGNVNLGCNGVELENVEDLIELDGEFVGGCEITVTEFSLGGNQVYGEVIIEPAPGNTISKFGVGGQEFFVDDLCFDC
jgi:hypothetical protein